MRAALIEQITPLIITFNEAPNIERTLDKLRWAKRIVVVDSCSTDETAEIVARYPQAELVCRPFDSFAEQCNFGLSQIRSEWVLSLDADYELSDELVEEIRQLEGGAVAAYEVNFIYRIHGRRLHGTLYPPRAVLYRVREANYENYGHGHKVRIAGKARRLRGVIYHDDRKPLSRWLRSQQAYAVREAEYLLAGGMETLSLFDRIRLLGWPAPVLMLFYTLFVKGCILDGWAGWRYALERLLAETMIALELLDRRRRGAENVSEKAGTGR